MAANSELIHAGLPWTNPQKVTIKSDEYVSDMTINRGFLNLLNNDYYLDLKTEAINRYIESTLDSHLADTDIHFSYSLVENLINSLIGLNKNCVCYIPIYNDEQIFGISQIKQLINNVAKNLNGFTLLFAFSIPVSKILNITINDQNINKDNYKDILKINATDIKNNNKIGPKELKNYITDSSFNEILTLDLEDHYNLSFDNFQSGNLIIYGNNEFFIDDLDEDGNININKFLNLYSTYDTTILLRHIQDKLLKIADSNDISSNSNNLITITSNGINLNHSVISTKNCTSQTYIYNLKIENTLIQDAIIDLNNYEFPEYNNIIGYWPLLENKEPQILNSEYLNPLDKFILNSQQVYIGTSGEYVPVNKVDKIPEQLLNISAQILNVDLAKMTEPGFFWFDDHLILDNNTSEKIQSNQIKDIIYNAKGNTPQTTLVFWGYQTISDTGNNPIFSDYNVNTGSGLYISPDLVTNGDVNKISTDAKTESTGTDYERYKSNLLNNWVMYAIEFQNKGGESPNSIATLSGMEPWATPAWQTLPVDNHIRINIRAYYKDSANATNITNVLLLPTQNQLTDMSITEYTISGIIEFTKPSKELESNINLFGVKRYNITSANNMNGWSVWNGAVRNLILFNKFLSNAELKNLYTKYTPKYYPWLDENESTIINQIDNNSYFGSIYSKNMPALSVVGCILKQNTQNLNLNITYVAK